MVVDVRDGPARLSTGTLRRPRWHPRRRLLAAVLETTDVALVEPGARPHPLGLDVHAVDACEWIPGTLELVVAARREPDGPVCLLRVGTRPGASAVLV